MNNLPKRPVRFQEDNQELLKSQGDYVNDTTVPSIPAYVTPSYRTPPDRVSGNRFFRRNLDGSLDMENARNVVVDAIHRFKQKNIPVGTQEAVVLSVIFPGIFCEGVDPLMAAAVGAVQLDLIPEEVAMLRILVARHFAEEINWNAGQGGGTVDGRNQTYDL